ncbi:MAG: hypothetical protein HRU07_09515 [Nitrosopumilus sp.]|nr:hypothetical protein [Nitrosopumilus sp.]NRA06364.1 hypothetical protein [Nitrosopumilus sp.]
MEIKITTINGVNLCNIHHIKSLNKCDIEKFAKGVLDDKVTGIDFDHNDTNWRIGNFIILFTKYSLHIITKDDWEKIQIIMDQIDRENESSISCKDGCGV